MSLIGRPLRPRDHRGIENGSDPGPRPRTEEGRPSEQWDGATSWSPPDGGWEDGQWGWHGRWHHHRRRGRLRHLRRDPDNRVLGGVAGGVSACTGIDVMWVRIGFVLLSIMSGVMVLGYAMAWLLLPMQGSTTSIASSAVGDRRGIRLVMAVCIPLLVVMQLVVSSLHVGFVGFIGWPTVLAAGVLVLVWRNADPSEKQFIDSDVVPLLGPDSHGGRRKWLVLRIAAGVAVAALGIYLLVKGHTTVTALRPVGGAALVVAASVIIFGPWWLSLIRDLIVERQARVRAEEREQMAAHVHDSVLQTLALIQRSADDPQNVVRLARAQERELRSWLFEGRPPGAIGEDATTLSAGVDLLQRHVEADHGITVQVVLVGDCDLDEGLRALLDAAKEASVNAAKWAGVDQVSLYAEVEPDQVMLYVRDRGRGFDPDAVPDGRQGIAQSIKARMERHGGAAVIRSAPGDGAEVQLSMPRKERVR
jgi:signal transduction histidine kinase